MKQLLIIPFLILLACSQFQKIHRTATTEYIESSRFTDGNTFKAVIRVKPEITTGSLVERRESAYMKAKTGAKQYAAQELANYVLTIKCADNNIAKVNQEYINKLVKKGYISEEYYDSDSTVNLIFSIKARSLKNKIDTEACKRKAN